MKLRLTLLAAAMATLSAPTFAGSALEVYGNAMLTVQNVDDEAVDSDKWEVRSHASRFGVKGDLGVSDDLSAFYQFEWEVDPADADKGSNDNIKSRNQAIGLKGGFGSVLVGRWDTPLKLAQGKVDQFNDLEFADMKFIFNGEVRANNTIQYTSPKIAGGLMFSIASLLQEKVDTDASPTDDDQNGLFDVLSYSVAWQGKDLFASLAITDNYGVDATSDHKDGYQDGGKTTRLTATYKIGDFQLGAMWQEYQEQTGTDSNLDGEFSDNDGMLLSVAWNVAEDHTLKLQHGESDIKLMGGEQTYFGYDFKAAKNVTLFAVVGETTQDADDSDKSYLAGGMKVVF